MKRTGCNKLILNNGDIIEYVFVWEDGEPREGINLIQCAPEISTEDRDIIIGLLKKYNIVQFKAYLQLESEVDDE